MALIGASLILGCTNTTAENSATPAASRPAFQTAQIIIKFKESADTSIPGKASFVDDLAHSSGVPLSYVRPMSGRMHLYRIASTVSLSQAEEAVSRLNRRNDVDYAEIDAIVRHQSR